MDFTVGMLVQNSIRKGLKYLGPLVVNVILYGLTIWIPYLNVGTTIGLYIGLPAKMARDEEISFTEIFNAKYRKNMGEVFLTMALVSMGVIIGFMFLIIPGYVICIAWCLSYLLVVDKEYNPMDAIKTSNNLTYGKKWTIFFGGLALTILVAVAMGILVGIFSAIHAVLGGLVGVVCIAIASSIFLAFCSELYGKLAASA